MKTGCSSAQQSVDCFTERHPAIQHGGISQATPRNRGRTWEILVIFSRHSSQWSAKCRAALLISNRQSPGKHNSLGPELLPALLTATSSRANNASVHMEVLPCHFLQVKKGTPPVRHTSGCHYNSAIGGRIQFLYQCSFMKEPWIATRLKPRPV